MTNLHFPLSAQSTYTKETAVFFWSCLNNISKKDLIYCKEKLSNKGIILCDDYNLGHTGVKKAVDEFVSENICNFNIVKERFAKIEF